MSVLTESYNPEQLRQDVEVSCLNDVDSFMLEALQFPEGSTAHTQARHREDYDDSNRRLPSGALRIVCDIETPEDEAYRYEWDIDDDFRPLPETVIGFLGSIADHHKQVHGEHGVDVRHSFAPATFVPKFTKTTLRSRVQ